MHGNKYMNMLTIARIQYMLFFNGAYQFFDFKFNTHKI